MATWNPPIEDAPTNAVASWLLVAALAALAVVDLLAGDWLWTGFALAAVAVALVPAAVTRDLSVIVSWEVLTLATLPVAAQFVGVVSDPLTYVAVAALALLVAVELDSFSTAEMPPWFAVTFVVMTTMTIAVGWSIAQYYADVLLGTTFIPGRRELMWDLVGATGGGVAAGVVFQWYLRRDESGRDEPGPDESGRDESSPHESGRVPGEAPE